MSWKGWLGIGAVVLLIIVAPVTMGDFARTVAGGIVSFAHALFPHG